MLAKVPPPPPLPLVRLIPFSCLATLIDLDVFVVVEDLSRGEQLGEAPPGEHGPEWAESLGERGLDGEPKWTEARCCEKAFAWRREYSSKMGSSDLETKFDSELKAVPWSDLRAFWSLSSFSLPCSPKLVAC